MNNFSTISKVIFLTLVLSVILIPEGFCKFNASKQSRANQMALYNNYLVFYKQNLREA